MDVSIIKPAASELVPRVSIPYIDVHKVMEDALDLTCPSDPGVPASNVLLNSPHGLGKTLLVANLAVKIGERAKTPIPLVVYDCSEDTRDYHLRGSFTISPTGETSFVLGPFPLVIELANEVGTAILCLEEISALTPGAQKQCNCMTDWREGIYVPQLGRNFLLKKGCRVIILATMNPSTYSGVYTLNSDLASRFDQVSLPFPSVVQEKKILKAVCPFADPAIIEKVCKLGQDGRTQATDYKLSTRDLVKLLQNIAKLKNLEKALRILANKWDGPDLKVMQDRINANMDTQIKWED